MSELNDLFQEDPLVLSKDRAARQKIIQKYRDDRQKFLLGQKIPKADKPKVDLDNLKI